MMFMISVTAKRLAWIGAAALVLFSATIGGVYLVSKQNEIPASAKDVTLRAETQEEQLAFFSKFGLSVDPDSKEVREIILPDTLDVIYDTYNGMQKQQGFDLTPYCGKRVKSWSYSVVGASDPSIDGSWRVNILVYRGKVIAADLAQPALDGTMRPLIPG